MRSNAYRSRFAGLTRTGDGPSVSSSPNYTDLLFPAHAPSPRHQILNVAQSPPELFQLDNHTLALPFHPPFLTESLTLALPCLGVDLE